MTPTSAIKDAAGNVLTVQGGPRLVGDPCEQTFADFWIGYQRIKNAKGEDEWLQIYYGKGKNEVLAQIKPLVRGMGFKAEDGEFKVTLYRDGQPLFCVLRQLLNYGWFARDSAAEIRDRIPPRLGITT